VKKWVDRDRTSNNWLFGNEEFIRLASKMFNDKIPACGRQANVKSIPKHKFQNPSPPPSPLRGEDKGEGKI